MTARACMLIAGSLCVAGCGAPTVRTVDDAPTWLELGGARMLVTTTHVARGRTDAGLPILVVLPWSRSSPAEALAEVGYTSIDVPARIIAIEGFERDGAGFSWWRRTRPAPGDPDRDDELVALLTERAARLAGVLGAVRGHFGAPALVVSGISQGGDLSVALGVLHPAAISAALPIASRFPAPMWPTTPVTAPTPPPIESAALPIASRFPAPMWPGAPAATALPPIDAFQGTADPVAPAASLQRAFIALRDRGYPAVLHLYDVAHEVSPALAVDVRACAALRLRGVRAPCHPRAP